MCSVTTKRKNCKTPHSPILPRSLHSARVVFQLILMEGRRKEAGVRVQSWELSMEQGEPEQEASTVSRTSRGSMSRPRVRDGDEMTEKGHLNSGSAPAREF